MREWLWRLRAMLRRDRVEAERQEELQFHYDMEVDAGLRKGLSSDAARRSARLRAGLVSDGLEATSEAMRIGFVDAAATELRHAVRALTRNRSYGAVAVLVLAASVAINTLIFFMLEGVVLRPLPYHAPDELVRVFDASPRQPKFPVAIGHYLEYRSRAASIEGIALYTGQDIELSTGDGGSRLLAGVAITPEYFSVLGHQPALGRAFTEADTKANIRHVILGHRLWRQQFGGDPSLVGRTIRLDRTAWTVVGVAPEGFQHVGGDYRSPLQGETVDLWVPLQLERENQGAIRYWHFCNAVARLRDGVTPDRAREELGRLATAYDRQFQNDGWTAAVEPLLGEVTGRSRQTIWLLAAAGALVVLVACANIAGLCVARAAARQRELSLRRALGANRWQLIRVGLAENLLMGVAGALLGLLLAGVGLPLLRQLLPADFPRAHEIGLTWRAALFASLVAMTTALVAGLVASGAAGRLIAQGRVTEGRESRRLRTTLVVGEIALAGLLCAGALFLARSFHEIGQRDHGFNASGVLTFQVALRSPGPPQPGAIARTFQAMREAIARVPGVGAVGATTNIPWSGYDENTGFDIVGRPVPDGADSPGARFQAATPGFFEAAGMRLVTGRFFEQARDVIGQPFSVVVNEALVRKYFPDGRALGARLDIFGEKREIVGIVGDVKDYPADLDTPPAVWFPLGQVEFGNVFVAVRASSGDPAALTSAVTAAVHGVDPDLPLADIRTLERRAAVVLAPRRFALWLFQAFAGLSLLLAAAGIYGLLAYIVRQRRKELGIRAALGASPGDLWRMVFADGLRMAGAGAIACLLLAPVGGWLLRSFLFNVRAFDPLTITGAPAVLLAMALVACIGPARAAWRSNPSVALRED
jgi:predicted permease